MKSNSFICAECGEKVHLTHLSRYSMSLVGTASRLTALEALEDDGKVCTRCSLHLDESLPESSWQIRPGRTDIERFEFSGLVLVTVVESTMPVIKDKDRFADHKHEPTSGRLLLRWLLGNCSERTEHEGVLAWKARDDVHSHS